MRVKLFVKEALTLFLVATLIMTFIKSPVLASINLFDGSENYLSTQNSGKDVTRFETLTEGEVEPNSAVRDEGNLNNTNERSEFNGDDRCSTQLVIRVNNRISDAYTQLMGIIAKYDCEVVNTVSMAGEIIAVVVDVSSAEAPSLAREMRAGGLSSYIEHRTKFQAQFVPNDPYWSLQWGPQKIEADWAWNTTIGGTSVSVAVIDTGIDWDHPDLAANYVALGYDWVNNDTDPMDDEGHGTHCAGIIAAVINNSIGVAGLAQVRIMAEKGLDQYGEGYEDDLANAMIHAVDQGADILSLSWGGYGESALIYDAVTYAYDAGVLVVAAAGNEATSTKLYPAAYDEVIAVTATDQYDNPASFTNFGEWVELAAPGVDIYSTYWDNTYTSMSGTSMSTPHVSGTAALIWSQFPNMTRDWARAQLRYAADDLGDPGFDDYYGYGRINTREAVEQAPPDHDLLIFDWERPPCVKLGELATFNTTVLNFGISNETNVEVQLLVNSSLIDSTSIAFLPGGKSTTVGLSWTPTVEGTYNVTSYVVPVPEETITQNNLITEIVTVIAPPSEAFWMLLATDPDEGVGTSLKAIYSQLYSDIIYFKVEHYRPWTTINDIDTGIFIDADQDPGTGLPDGFYPGQNTGIGADYVIVVGWQATEMWKWDPIAEMWDLGNPISFAYLDAPDGSNVFVVGVFLASVETAGILDCAVTDVESDWDWMPDAGYFTWFLIRYEHELTVFLETPQHLQPSETSLLNVTVYNVGLNNETNVDIQLLINGTEVASETVDELVSGTWYTINYSWTPIMEGTYNITAYAPPVPGENLTANNIAMRLVLVRVLPDIIVVNDDDGGSWVSGTSLHEFESALIALGYDYWVWNESSMGNPSLDFLTKFELVIWTCGDYWSGAVDPTDAATLESYLAQGGNILLEGEDIGYDHHADDFMVNVAHAIYQVDDTGALGLTVTDPTHPVTQNLPTSFAWLTDPPYDDGVSPTNGGAEVIQYTGTTWTAVTVFEGASNGSVVYYAFPLYCLAQPDGETLAADSISWLLGIRYEHELAVKLEAPDFLEPGDSSLLNATVYNRGLNTETDVDLFLLINGTIVNNVTIPELVNGTYYTINYLWTPTVEAVYNVTSYVEPVPGENVTANNFATKIVTVRFAKYVLWDDVHDGDGDSLTGNYLSLYQLLSSSGFVVDELASGTINSGVLAPYDILVLIDPEYDFSSSEISDIHDWVASGGALIVIPDAGYPSTLNTIMTPYGVQLTGLDTGYGTTTDIIAHPITQDVESIYYDRAWELAVSSPSETLAWTLEYYAFLSATTGGEVAVISDSNIMDNYMIGMADNSQLMLNMFNWIGVKYEHDLSVSMEAPDFLEPGDSSLLNATVYNRGLNTETDVEPQLLINGTVVESGVIPELQAGSSYTLSYLWTPTVEGIYNVTAYAPPLPSENITINNVNSRYVIVSCAVKILAYVQYTDYDQEYANALIAIESTFGPNYLLTELWDYTQLDSVLPGNDILFIPEQENADLYTMESIGATWSTTLSNFLNEGGVMILCDHTWGGGGTYGILTGAGLMSISGSNSITGSTVYLVDPSDPLAEGVSNTFIAPNGALSFITAETNVVFNDGTYPVAIHKTIGLGHIALIGFDYFASNPDADRILGNAVGLWIRYEHDIAVSLEASTILEPNDSSLLNATAYNRGLNNETDVDLFLSINGTVVNSITIPELLTGEFYTINYLWTPVVEAAYNLTAYASPVPGENITTNNFATRIVVVTPLRYILFDQTHGTDSITNYNTWVVSLTQRGYVVDTHTTGPIDSAVLAGYDVFVIAQAHDPYTSDELSAIQNFVVAGGGLLVIGDDQPYIYTDLTGFAGISWMSGGVSGITTDIAPHEVTRGVSSVYLDAPVAMMTVTGVAQDLVRDPAGNIMLAVSEHLGRVIGFADEGSLWNYGITHEDNLLLANNMIDWLVIKYEHDLSVRLNAPSFLKPGSSSLLNATVHNRGLSNETDVELQLLINGTEVESIVIPELLSNSYYTLSYLWTPTVEATYNVTACALPVLGEEITANNQESKFVEVFEMVVAVVLDSYGTDYASSTFWDYLNTNWATYGTRRIVVDYTSLNKENITLADIEATHADVLIISDAWSDTYEYGWEFSDSEIEAIKTYVLSGHGIMATSGTFDTWSAPNNQKLAELFGMDPTIWYNWGGNGEQKATSGTFELQTPRHNELWRNIPDPYLSGSLVTLNPTPSSDWTTQGVTTGWIEALSTDHYAAVITNEAITYKAVYFTCMLESMGQYNENNRQLFYNAIVWLHVPVSPVASFTWTPPIPKVGEPVTFDASASTPNGGTIITYKWDFGDGNTTTTSTPIIYHSYETAGNYYVTLTVYAPGATPETDSTTHVVTVVSVPVGGYSLPISTHTIAKPPTLHIALIAILTVAFIVIRRKTPRKTR